MSRNRRRDNVVNIALVTMKTHSRLMTNAILVPDKFEFGRVLTATAYRRAIGACINQSVTR
jgi:hypothetical protein